MWKPRLADIYIYPPLGDREIQAAGLDPCVCYVLTTIYSMAEPQALIEQVRLPFDWSWGIADGAKYQLGLGREAHAYAQG